MPGGMVTMETLNSRGKNNCIELVSFDSVVSSISVSQIIIFIHLAKNIFSCLSITLALHPCSSKHFRFLRPLSFVNVYSFFRKCLLSALFPRSFKKSFVEIFLQKNKKNLFTRNFWHLLPQSFF